MVGVTPPTITNIKKHAIERGLMDKNHNPTEKGQQFLDDFDYDLSEYYDRIN